MGDWASSCADRWVAEHGRFVELAPLLGYARRVLGGSSVRGGMRPPDAGQSLDQPAHTSRRNAVADTDERRTFPRIPAKNWWALRERFKQTMPNRVDSDYLQSVLGLTTAASAGNLIGPLRTVGLIGDEGQPTDRAFDWREDDSYKQVCEDMLNDVYPDTLRSAFPDPSEDQDGVTSWFSRNTGAGRNTATKMAALYSLMSAGDPGAGGVAASAATAPNKRATARAAAPKPKSTIDDKSGSDALTDQRHRVEPELNINVQIHISPDASADQIDQIFRSMSEHLYGGG